MNLTTRDLLPVKPPGFRVSPVSLARRRTLKRSRFTDEQIIGILKEHHAGATAKDLCRKHGISDATFYKWRSRYGGMEVSEARRLKTLEDENAKLKRLLGESMLDVSTLREMLAIEPRERHAFE